MATEADDGRFITVSNDDTSNPGALLKTIWLNNTLHIVFATTVMQLRGHKNVASVNEYSSASLQQQQTMSYILSDIGSGSRGFIPQEPTSTTSMEAKPADFPEDDIFDSIELNKSMSLTDQITCYRIPRKDGSTVRFKLCIVDTPGFGDVRGTNFDKTIIEMVKHLFRKGIQNIDALCLVMKLSDKRLTDSQQYVFSSILEIFAKDISDNIFVLLTNDDGEAGKPQALDALTEAKVPYKEDMVFRFKNGNLFNSESNESEWKARNTSFKNFFDKLQTIGKISVENTKTVLNTRESLEIQLDNIQKKIRYQAVEILHIKRDENALKLHEVDIEKNKNFTITKEVQRPTTVSRQSYCLNCKHCNATCHYDCKVVLDCLILTCVMMTWKKCTSCSCYSDKHALEKLSHETKIVSETQTLSDIKMQYSVAMQGAEGYKEMINKNKVNLRESLLELDKMIQKAGDWIKQLQNEALQPAVRNMDEYIDRILAKENEKEHIEIIKMVKKKASANRSMTDLINDL
ncbi:uncharacterized protein LOC134726721 [Mytilus trossulus]|uniref:uncharacterized protein LOC134726721 n=1 Tax=Mytilus trossulus TaxID=6551 RepID=UPI00300737FA